MADNGIAVLLNDNQKWWSVPISDLLEKLGVDQSEGLSSAEVEEKRGTFGENRLEDRGPTSLWTLLWESVTSPMMLVLLAIAGISLLLGQTREAIVMAGVVAIYVGVHLLNKARSDRTMAKLREMQSPKTTVLREGQKQDIDSEKVVVGDILPLRPGSRVPADARLLVSAGLLLNEAPLTGESTPVRKDANAEISIDTQLADRKTAVYAGTTVMDGQGKAIVVAVGESTELGRVAGLAAGGDSEPTPLQKEMDDLAKTLAYVALAVSLIIPLIGLLRGFDFQQMVLTWLSLTFLMVPGQPPIIIAMALALAALELSRKGVIVRRLHGAETLGSVNVILSDKTGTMTENQMALTRILTPEGEIILFDEEEDNFDDRIKAFFEAALPSIPETTKEPTDVALLNKSESIGDIKKMDFGSLIDFQGFSRTGTYRSLSYKENGDVKVYITGRPEFIIKRSDKKWVCQNGAYQPEKIDEKEKENLLAKLHEFAEQGKRLTAYAFHQGELKKAEPTGLIFAGVAVISDPIRPEVRDSIKMLAKAGVDTKMVTGDIQETAVFVANHVGLETDLVYTGNDLEAKTKGELEQIVLDSNVFARTTPEQKLKLVQALQSKDKVVGVTGDGINDAPALRAAQIGIAMGKKGTDVARQAADLVLTDDNFAHLPDGVSIGRKAYDNFRKGIIYYLSAKAILLSIFIVPLIIGIEFPFSPIQIIFTELLMDLASSTIFISESSEPDVMERPPRKQQKFLSWDVGKRILRNTAGLATAILAVYLYLMLTNMPLAAARTAAFSTWLLGHIILALNLKQEKKPLLKQGLLSNKFAIGWLVGMVLLVIGMTQWGWLQTVLGTTDLSSVHWILVIAGAIAASSWLEIRKWIRFSD